MKKLSKEQIIKLVFSKLNHKEAKINLLDILKKFIKLPTKQEAEKIVQDSTKKEFDDAVKYLPKITQPEIKESFSFSSIKKQLLLIAAIAILGASEGKADTYLFVEKPDGWEQLGKALNKMRQEHAQERTRNDIIEDANYNAFKRLNLIFSKFNEKEVMSITTFLESQDTDLDMLDFNDVKKEHRSFFSKLYKIQKLHIEDMEGSNLSTKNIKNIFKKLLEEIIEKELKKNRYPGIKIEKY